METNTHPFEKAGLGLAPFKFVGMVDQDLCHGRAILNREEYQRTGISVTTKPGGSCDYCGQYILHMFQVESADGRRFKVGSDCVEKTTIKTDPLRRAVAREVRKATVARERARIERARELVPSLDAALSARPSLNAHRAERHGETALDWVDFMLEKAGHAGKLRAARFVEKVLAEVTR